MTDGDKLKFAEIMTAMCVMFDKEPNEAMLRVYFAALKDLTIEQVQQALVGVSRQSKFFPKPAEIRELVQGDPEGLAVEAWRIACEAIARHGGYRAVDFADKAINATVRSLGGWTAFCDMPVADETFWRARFIKTYQAYYRAGVSEEAGRPLVGIGEATSVKRIGEQIMIANTPRRIECK